MSADVSDDFVAILDKKIDSLRTQLRLEKYPLSLEVQERLAAALRIREHMLPAGPGRTRKPVDVLAEWRRWERDILAFEPKH